MPQVKPACRRLTIAPEELWRKEANGDLTDLESGAVSGEARCQVAMTLTACGHKKPRARRGLNDADLKLKQQSEWR
jgi:hypothetical protein